MLSKNCSKGNFVVVIGKSGCMVGMGIFSEGNPRFFAKVPSVNRFLRSHLWLNRIILLVSKYTVILFKNLAAISDLNED